MTIECLNTYKTYLACQLNKYASSYIKKLMVGDSCAIKMRQNFITAFHLYDLLCILNTCQTNSTNPNCNYNQNELQKDLSILLNQELKFEGSPPTSVTEIIENNNEITFNQQNIIDGTYSSVFYEYNNTSKYITKLSYTNLLNSISECPEQYDSIFIFDRNNILESSGDYFFDLNTNSLFTYFYYIEVVQNEGGVGKLRIGKIFLNGSNEFTEIETTPSTSLKFIADPCEQNIVINIYNEETLLDTTILDFEFADNYAILPILAECNSVNREASFTYNSIAEYLKTNSNAEIKNCECCLTLEEQCIIINKIKNLIN